MAEVSINAAATIFVVQDVAKSVAYYRDVLGFKVDFTYGEPTFYAGVERGDLAIHLSAAAETKRQRGQGGAYAFVTGVDDLYRELKDKNARTLGEPKDYPYGMRDFDLEDPDGNRLTFGESKKS